MFSGREEYFVLFFIPYGAVEDRSAQKCDNADVLDIGRSSWKGDTGNFWLGVGSQDLKNDSSHGAMM